MMAKIRDAEHTQAIAEMRRRIAELEIEVNEKPEILLAQEYNPLISHFS